MEIELLKPYGYCAGVASAMDMALKAKNANPNNDVVVLGMLVHNENALKTLEKAGIKTIYEKGKQLTELVDLVPLNSIVVLTAHGHSKELEDILNSKGISFIDATCPFVDAAHKAIKEAVSKGKEVIYIGKEGHPEAVSALSISNKVHLLSVKDKKIPIGISTDDPLIISQTTFSHFDIDELVKEIKNVYAKAHELKGICHASDSRQSALLSLDNDVDLIYVVGGKNSNNTNTLLHLAKSHYPSAKVIAIQDENEINKKDLIGLSHIVISSGASTPMEVSEAIYNKIKLLCD